MRDDNSFAEMIAGLFLEGRNNQFLTQQVADFYLRQMALPTNWVEVIRDPNVIDIVVRKMLAGAYTNKKGKLVEGKIRSILNGIEQKCGVTHAHGQVALVGKEIDHAIPSLSNPYIMVMVSYMETTSSGQTARANEQQTMYLKIEGENLRYPRTKRIFVNVLDGAGWLARRSDLRKMHASCHYCLNMKTLDQLEAIIYRYVPPEYFTSPPEQVIEG